MILILINFIDFNIKNFYLKNNNKIINNKKIINLNFIDSWYLLYFKNFLNLKNFFLENNINLINYNLLNNNWMEIFLTSENAKLINLNKNFNLKIINKNYKTQELLSINNNFQNYSYILKAHNNFKNPFFSEMVLITKNLYLIKISNINQLIENNLISYIIGPFEINFFNRWVTGFLQNNEIYPNYNLNPFLRSTKTLNLNGTGSIVTIIDTGIDRDHCFFTDKNRPIPINQNDPNHRKIIRYSALVDNNDKINGHGTHCAGTIAGYSECNNCSINLYSGHAINAKLHIVDVAPDSYSHKIIMDGPALFYAITNSSSLNSKIISCSWGIEESSGQFRYLFDHLSIQYPEILFVFASGNFGQVYSVLSPADSKNILTVGASTNPLLSSLENINFRKSYLFLNNEYHLIDCPLLFNLMSNDPLESFENLNLINFSNFNNISKSIVFIENITNLNNIILDLKNQNIKGIIIKEDLLNNNNNNFLICKLNNFNILKNISKISLRINSTLNDQNQIKVAHFTSIGPTIQGILKPEIFAPGEGIYSSKSNSQSIISRQGTSMAAPSISGLLSLIEQFLIEKRYELPFKINISSHLLKAFIIQACSLKSNPSPSKGFGIPSLERVLKINNEKGLRFESNNISSLNHYIYEIYLDNNNSLFSITLTYLDLPIDPSHFSILFGDIDLFIVDPNKNIIYGNQNPLNQEESFSTIEKIIIFKPLIGKYEIHIQSSEYLDLNINLNYSIVINGPFNHYNFSLNSPILNRIKPLNCLKCNQCSNNYLCLCNSSFTGIHCQNPINNLNFEQFTNFLIPSRSFLYLKINIPNNFKKYIKLTINPIKQQLKSLIRIILNKNNNNKLSIPKFNMKIIENKNEFAFILIDKEIQQNKILYLSIFADSFFDLNLTLKLEMTNTISNFNLINFNLSNDFIELLIYLIFGFLIGILLMYLIKKFQKKKNYNENDEQLEELI